MAARVRREREEKRAEFLRGREQRAKEDAAELEARKREGDSDLGGSTISHPSSAHIVDLPSADDEARAMRRPPAAAAAPPAYRRQGRPVTVRPLYFGGAEPETRSALSSGSDDGEGSSSDAGRDKRNPKDRLRGTFAGLQPASRAPKGQKRGRGAAGRMARGFPHDSTASNASSTWAEMLSSEYARVEREGLGGAAGGAGAAPRSGGRRGQRPHRIANTGMGIDGPLDGSVGLHAARASSGALVDMLERDRVRGASSMSLSDATATTREALGAGDRRAAAGIVLSALVALVTWYVVGRTGDARFYALLLVGLPVLPCLPCDLASLAVSALLRCRTVGRVQRARERGVLTGGVDDCDYSLLSSYVTLAKMSKPGTKYHLIGPDIVVERNGGGRGSLSSMV